MKNLLVRFSMIAALMAIALSADVQAQSINDDNAAPPMFLLGNYQGLMQMVYWSEAEEPQFDEEYAEFYDRAHQEWALQESFRRNAAKYTKLIVEDTQTQDLKYVEEIWLNPDGEKMYLGELHGRPQIPSPGALFSLDGGLTGLENDVPGVIAVTDSYLATHKLMAIKPASEDEILPLPAKVIKAMEAKYGMKVERSVMNSIIGDRYTYGVLQFQGQYMHPQKHKDPEYGASLALEIILDGEKIYSYPVEGYYLPDEGPIWHVDDGGEYFPGNIMAAFQGPEGPEFYFVHWAPESATTGRLMVRNGELDCQEYTVYHSLIDEALPVWKKDIAEMKRLYVADDPGENGGVELTKWAHVFIDYDGEQIWISDAEEENGAFFSREDGQLKLIGTVRPNLKPSFPQHMGNGNYLVLSGPAGGPSYYYEIYKMMNGEVVEKFNALEVYGEIDECTLNGKTISAAEGKAYMEAIPDAEEPFIFWTDIENN